jgi:hypothetical protein
VRNPLVCRHTFESTGVTVLRLRQPLRWWRRRQFKRYLKKTGVGDPTRFPVVPIMADPKAVRLFERMDYWDSHGSLRA